MAICDVCSGFVDRGDGFLLTTKTVVTQPAYWERAFRHQLSSYLDIDPDESLEILVRQRIHQALGSPWLVCGSCIALFDGSFAAERMFCKVWWLSGQRWNRRDASGPPLAVAVAAARTGWDKAKAASSAEVTGG